MDLYLIRHGRTIFNQEDRHQYSTTPLAKEGFVAAEKLATRLSGLHFDALYSSPMLRAVQTADVLAKAWGQKVVERGDLRERKQPSVFQGKSKGDESVLGIKSMIETHFNEPTWHHSDEENLWDLRNRVLKFLHFLQENHKPDETILGVSHEACLKMIVATIIFGEQVIPEQYLSIYYHTRISNTGITHVEHNPDSGWKLVTFNDDAHL